MKTLICLIFTFLVAACSQPTPKHEPKISPQYTSQISDPELKVIVDAYFDLSRRNNIVFGKNVSIGFSEIKREMVIGTCTYGQNFREIDLDSNYWKEATWNEKVALVYHELNHCYCGRAHDFDNGTMYPDNSIKYILQKFFSQIPMTPMKPEGYLDDGCPKSLMAPVILSDACFEKHYSHYATEMFNRCEPWR